MGGKGELEFVIPLTLDALQEAPTTRQYAVTYISSSNEIPRKLQECQASFRQQGSEFVCDGQQFDALYSVLVHFKELDPDVREKAFDLMVKVLGRLTTDLATLLDDIASLDTKQRHHWLNALKMSTFIAVSLTEAFESYHNKPSQDALLGTGKGRKRGGGVPREDGSGVWEDQRTRVLLQLYSLMQHPLHRLCSPPVMEEDYVNLVSNCCYKILETPSLGQSRSKGTRDSLFQIIGSLVNRFNHGLACCLKIMQLVQHFEHLVSVSANGLALLVNHFGCFNVVGEVVREIAKMDLGGVESTTGSISCGKDSATVRNYTQFLMELTELVPQAMVPSLPLLFTFLDNDNYSLRNCMLCMMGSLVRRVLSREDLDDKSRDLRDNCLDCIEDHLLDVHAFVRSKVLQIILELVEGNKVPLSRQQRLLELTVARLMDKVASVRKNALVLMTAFLKQNPFAAKLPLADLQQQYEMEQTKLTELCPEPLVQQDNSAGKDSSPHTLWQEKLNDVIDAVKDVLDEDSDAEDYSDDALSEECTLNDAVSSIAVALETGKLHRAAVLLSGALEAFHGATVLSFDPSSAPPVQKSRKGEEGEEELSPDQQKHVALLSRIFLSSQAMIIKNKDKAGEAEQEENEKLRESDEVTKQRKLVTYLKDSVGFAKLIQAALPLVVQLLSSKLVSDVLEAIKFFVTAFEFGVLDAMAGVRAMLVQIWSREQPVQTAVVEAYRRLYINGDGGVGSDRTKAQYIVRNLTALTTGATLGELASLEEIIAQFMAAGDLTTGCITLLWERFTLALPETTHDEAKAALTLLAMAANSEANIVTSNIGVVVTSALGERGEKDFSLVKEACVALAKIANNKPKTDAAVTPFRLEEDHEMFTRLCTILVEGITKQEDKQYSPMAVQAVTTIYSLAEHPDLICGRIIQQLSDELNKLNKTETEHESMETDANIKDLTLPTFVLSRFLVLVGRVAIRQLVHLDTFVFSELKRRTHLKEEHETKKMENKKKSKKKNEEKNRKKILMTSATEASMIRGSSQEGDIDEELGMMGAVADDMEAEYIRSICDKELVNGDNLLGLIMPVISCVCTNPSKYPDPDLQAAAGLALSNCMMVSADCCESNLQLLFTILEKSDDPVIRGNTIIALGDLSFRYPNLVEPWTPRLYARLSDDCCSVRHNTITVLTHLILNDMVKVKGQIADIALRITDHEPRISGLAKLFFTELSRKANALYNVLPDIISRLSDPEAGLEEHKYRTVIAHIFSLIQKDKQVEGLVEKLCHRLQDTTAPRQWRDITYCLSLLHYNEKCIRKLGDLFSCYGDKLYEADVHKMFLSILAKARKLSKPETKAVIEELEAKIEKSHEKGVDEQNLVDKAAAATRGGPTKQPAKRSNVRMAAGRRAPPVSSDSEEDLVMSDSDNERAARPATGSSKTGGSGASRRIGSRVRKSTAKAAVSESEEEESSDDDEESSAEDDEESGAEDDEEESGAEDDKEESGTDDKKESAQVSADDEDQERDCKEELKDSPPKQRKQGPKTTAKAPESRSQRSARTTRKR